MVRSATAPGRFRPSRSPRHETRPDHAARTRPDRRDPRRAGAGLGLLLADRLEPGPRRAIGLSLVAIGLASTVPLAIDVLGKIRRAEA